MNMKDADRISQNHYFKMTGDPKVKDPFVTEVVIRAYRKNIDKHTLSRLKAMLSAEAYTYIAKLIKAQRTQDHMTILTALNTSYVK